VYVVAPDLFVDRIDRALIESIVAELLATRQLKDEWLCPPGIDD
jgi:hypothetical protein